MNLPINIATPEIAAWHPRWKKNRAFVAGEDAVKSFEQLFLPKIRDDDGITHYRRHLMNTCFYPATAKIAMGMQGLIDRKPAKFETTSARVALLSKSITPRNHSLTELGRQFIREKIITNFTGLLADHPSREGFTSLNAENADRKGFRPRVMLYSGENILEVTEGPVGLNHQLISVRLLEEDGIKVRHLLINDDGVYEQRIYSATAGGAFDERFYSTSIPLIDGKPLTEIPFVLDTSEGGIVPTPSILETAVDLNLQHYRLSGALANMTWMTSGPQLVLAGFVRELNEDGSEKDPEFDFGPNGVIELRDKDCQVYYNTFDPKNSLLITDQLDKIEKKLSTLNHSILAPEKAAPEAPETLILRRVAEGATLAGFTQSGGESMNKVLGWFARWVDGSEATFSFNMDFAPAGLSAAEHKAVQDDFTLGIVPHKVTLQALVDGEVYPADLDIEATIELVKMEQADRPTPEA